MTVGNCYCQHPGRSCKKIFSTRRRLGRGGERVAPARVSPASHRITRGPRPRRLSSSRSQAFWGRTSEGLFYWQTNMKTTKMTMNKTSRTRGRPMYDERQFRELGDLFLRATDPEEQ